MLRELRYFAATLLFACCSFACWNHPLTGIPGPSEAGEDSLGLLLPLLGVAGGETASNPVRLIFRTATNYNGNLQAGGGGVTEGDAICAAEATAFGYAGTYKALLGTEVIAATPRFACRNAFCSPPDPTDGTNWVLGANVDYYRASDNAFIGTSTADRIFRFPLSNPYSPLPGAWHWGGFFRDWRPPSGPGSPGFGNNDFNAWTGTTGNGWISYSFETSDQAIYSGTTAGATNPNMFLVCVGQL
ncbi:MAG: DUF1554 domain-containing protein [Leptospirales bacterium]|jgi:hypothetical protein